MQTYSITNNSETTRFETRVDGHLAVLDYTLREGVMQIDYVSVPYEIGGRGIGGALVKAAVDWADEQGLRIHAVCGFARSAIEKMNGMQG